jgi:hypothetical protein
MGPGDICTNVVVMWGTYQIIETRGMCVWKWEVAPTVTGAMPCRRAAAERAQDDGESYS